MTIHIHKTLTVFLLFITALAYAQDDQRAIPPMVFVDNDADSLLDLVELYSGKDILRKQDLPPVKITFEGHRNLTKQEAVALLESLLAMNGIVLTDVGDEYIKAVKAETTIGEVPRILSGELAGMVPTQQVYSYFFTLDFLKAVDFQKQVEPFLTGHIGKVNVFEAANSLLITDSLINLQRIAMLLHRIDKPMDVREEMMFLKLKHVAATDLQKQLQTMQKGSLKQYLDNTTTFEADERTNQLIVITHPGNEKLINQLISNLDIDVAPLTDSEVIVVNNAEAKAVADLINEIISGQQDAQQDSAPTTGTSDPSTTAPVTTAAGTVGGADAGGAKLQFSEHVKIVADERSNSILAYGTASDIDNVADMVEKIDVLLAQVRVEVIVAEVTLGDDQVRGIDSFGVSVDPDQWQLQDLTGPSSGDLSSPFTISTTYSSFTMATVVNTAKQLSNVSVLSAPRLVTTHNQEASFVVGEARPIITSTTSSGDNLNTTSSVSRENIGIELKVKPLIGSNGIIQMEIEQKVEKVIDTTQIDNNDQPIVGTREAKSYVSVADGEIIVLGGLQEVEESEGEGRAWILGSLPVIGDLFSSNTHSRTVRELILFIRPTILRLPEQSTPMAEEEIKRIRTREEIQDYLTEGRFIEEDEVEVPKKSTLQKYLP